MGLCPYRTSHSGRHSAYQYRTSHSQEYSVRQYRTSHSRRVGPNRLCTNRRRRTDKIAYASTGHRIAVTGTSMYPLGVPSSK
eukprot:1767805-Rhodomonas_salina.1